MKKSPVEDKADIMEGDIVMERQYVDPEIEILYLETEDIITGSISEEDLLEGEDIDF